VRMGCYPDGKLGEECPFPAPKQKDCCQGVGCPGLPMEHPVLACLPTGLPERQKKLEE
jgi:hypothetical protein